jgi:hypothetical protein
MHRQEVDKGDRFLLRLLKYFESTYVHYQHAIDSEHFLLKSYLKCHGVLRTSDTSFLTVPIVETRFVELVGMASQGEFFHTMFKIKVRYRVSVPPA